MGLSKFVGGGSLCLKLRSFTVDPHNFFGGWVGVMVRLQAWSGQTDWAMPGQQRIKWVKTFAFALS